MDLPLVDADQLKASLTMAGAIAALEDAFGDVPSDLPQRQHLDVGGGDLLLMPAWSAQAAGVKLVTVAPDNPQQGLPLIHGIYVLFGKPSLQPIALFDAGPLTALRTSAVSALATKHLARSDSRRLLIFGAGVQGRAHLAAMHSVLELDTVRIVSRTESEAAALVTEAVSLGLDAAIGRPADVATSHVICTCTTSASPLFDGELLAPGTHVNAVGSYRPEARELDDAAISRSSVFVDTPTALKESGDLRGPLQSDVLERDDIRLLGDVLDGSGRRTSDDITIFKSVGAAFEDLAVAEAAAARL